MQIENINPSDIERRSMEIIESEISEMGNISHLSEREKLVLKRVIHTTADFDYVNNLKFSENAVETGIKAIKNHAVIITDTNMILSGISKPALKALECEAYCFMNNFDVADKSRESGVTRAVVSMDKAAERFPDNVIFAVGNAPTALIRLHELINSGKVNPSLIIGVPVGFVNVIYSKELIIKNKIPYIISQGRKGGSTVAVSICNALLYQVYDRKTGGIIV